MTALAAALQESTHFTPVEAVRQAQIYLARNSLLAFIRTVAPWFIIEECHVAICLHLEAAERGEIDRLMIHMPPRAGKTSIVSVFYVAWYFGRHPDDKVLSASHSNELVQDNLAEVLNIMRSEIYLEIFPETVIKSAKARQFTLQNDGTKPAGVFNGAGMGKKIAGKGANLGVIDDLISEQEALSPVMKNKAERWYKSGFYTRLQPERAIVIVMATRWAHDDPPGRLQKLAKENPEADQWTILSIPAILDEDSARILNACAREDPILAANDNQPLQAGDSFAPIRFPIERVRRSKANMLPRDFNAQYMQRPTDNEGSILLASMFRVWEKKVPECVYIASFYDTAWEEKQESDYSARITVGIFEDTVTIDTGGKTADNREVKQYRPFLVEAWRDRLQSPALFNEAVEHYKLHRPDRILVEKKASGIGLVQALRNHESPAIPVQSWLPDLGRGMNDKITRANLSALTLGQAPLRHLKRQWATDFIEECKQFPFGQHDDWVDCLTMAILWLRKHHLIQLPTDVMSEEDELERDVALQTAKKRRLYG